MPITGAEPSASTVLGFSESSLGCKIVTGVKCIFQEKNITFMYSHMDSVASVMFVERSSRHRETHGKSTKSNEFSLSSLP